MILCLGLLLALMDSSLAFLFRKANANYPGQTFLYPWGKEKDSVVLQFSTEAEQGG